MIREVVKIDEDKCTGCGNCIPSCHEGALQIIDGKARLISDLMCDGLGACLGHCPEDAMVIERREAEPYNETKVMSIMVEKGMNTVVAHLKHLKEHNEREYLKEGVQFLRQNESLVPFDINEVIEEVHNSGQQKVVATATKVHGHHPGGGCPGSREISFQPQKVVAAEMTSAVSAASELRQWPVQLHLLNPNANYFQQADVVLSADCVAYSLGGFHQKYLKGKALAIACPKLDSGLDSYISKLKTMIDEAQINTLTVMIMQVPCCSGLMQIAKSAVQSATRNIPVKQIVVSLEGDILKEEWV